MNRLRRALSARLTVAVLAIVLQGTVVVAGSAPALADQWSDIDAAYSLVNDARAWEGVAPLGWDDNLAGVAQAWADELAWDGRLAHNPYLADQLWDWWSWGENVGYGPSIGLINDAWLNSWHHWLNTVEPSFSSVGIGIAYGDRGRIYAVVVFAG
jgi:uncharacterized protein YkwD